MTGPAGWPGWIWDQRALAYRSPVPDAVARHRTDVHQQADRATELLAGVTYKPGWRLEVTPGLMSARDDYGATLRILWTAPDSRDPGSTIQLQARSAVPPSVLSSRRTFARWLRDQLQRAELHELDEWLRVDGELLNDPHA